MQTNRFGVQHTLQHTNTRHTTANTEAMKITKIKIAVLLLDPLSENKINTN
jgi:hypothetical protein